MQTCLSTYGLLFFSYSFNEDSYCFGLLLVLAVIQLVKLFRLVFTGLLGFQVLGMKMQINVAGWRGSLSSMVGTLQAIRAGAGSNRKRTLEKSKQKETKKKCMMLQSPIPLRRFEINANFITGFCKTLQK